MSLKPSSIFLENCEVLYVKHFILRLKQSLIIGFSNFVCKEVGSHYEQWKNTEVIDMPPPGEV